MSKGWIAVGTVLLVLGIFALVAGIYGMVLGIKLGREASMAEMAQANIEQMQRAAWELGDASLGRPVRRLPPRLREIAGSVDSALFPSILFILASVGVVGGLQIIHREDTMRRHSAGMRST